MYMMFNLLVITKILSRPTKNCLLWWLLRTQSLKYIACMLFEKMCSYLSCYVICVILCDYLMMFFQ